MPLAPSCNRDLAAVSASSRLSTMCPRGTATPYFERMAFAWYSCIFIFDDDRGRTNPLLRLLRRLHKSNETGDCIGAQRVRAMTPVTNGEPRPYGFLPLVPLTHSSHIPKPFIWSS